MSSVMLQRQRPRMLLAGVVIGLGILFLGGGVKPAQAQPYGAYCYYHPRYCGYYPRFYARPYWRPWGYGYPAGGGYGYRGGFYGGGGYGRGWYGGGWYGGGVASHDGAANQ
jgi:hypothetical protein